MAIDATAQVLPTSVDTTGLSIVSSRMTAEDPRRGTIYNPNTFAAAVPVYFHPLQDGNYLALFRTRWTDTTAGRSLQTYATHTSSSEPTWVVVNPATGQAASVDTVPTRLTGYTDRLLNGACSRVDFLFTTGTVDSVGYVAFHRISRDGSLLLQAEETLAVTPSGVRFGYGCYLDGDFLVVFGRDGDGVVYQARKRWSRVGVNNSTDFWLYRGERGWVPDPDDLSPVTTAAGPITSTGPVSLARDKDRMLLSTVQYADGAYEAQVYSKRLLGHWKPDGDRIFLGFDPEYLGGGLFFQSQLPGNRTLYPEGTVSAIPYLASRIDRSYLSGDGGPTVVGVSSHLDWTGNPTMTVSRPSGVTDGDLLIAVTFEHRTGVSITPPAGWTLVDSVAATAPQVSAMRLYTKTADSEPSTSNWGWSNGWSGGIVIVAVRRASGLADHAFTVVTAATATPTAPSIFAAAGGLLLCFAASRITGSAITSTPPSAMTEIVDAHYATESWVSAASLADPEYGATGVRSFTASASVGEPGGFPEGYPLTLSVLVAGTLQYAVDTAWGVWPVS